ncbi:MAG: hypothetical protein DWQ04_09725 [Chloroflexi bacterium]|nr:MAG: hypothetical protein DWQ04_09725 [Chloroflexota bacterium]
MESWKIYEGFYSFQEMTVQVRMVGEQLTVAFPGVPPGFEVVLQPQDGPHSFLMRGGPANGATAVFTLNEAGQAMKIEVGGDFTLSRTEQPPEPDGPTGQGLLPPELVLAPEKVEAFQALLDEVLEKGNGRFLHYHLPYPKYEFLQYAAMQDQIIFHGSKKPDIDLFSMKRTSMEMNDTSGRGNLQAVYGTHDGLWPMFFAVIDRANLTGSIRNGVNYYQNAVGDEVAVYNFSINKEILEKRPYSPGTLYFLSRETFRRLPLAEGAMSNEWASEVAIKPLAKLALEPEDFPFLEQIGGHDDSILVRAQELTGQVVTAVVQSDAASGQIRMQLDWTSELGPILLEYIEMQRMFVPTATLTLQFEPEAVWLQITGPPAYLQVLQNRLDEK